MNLQPIPTTRRRGGFTLLEIAVALAVIGFAIVAVLGVLPTALNVQRDTRERTVVLQDANYFIEAIRRGAQGTNDLASYVEALWDFKNSGTPAKITGFGTDRNVFQLLSQPNLTSITNKPNQHLYTVALVRSLSGSAAEKGPNATGDRIAFKYFIKSEITPILSVPEESLRPLTAMDSREDDQRIVAARRLENALYEMRFTIYWPAIPQDFSPSSPPKNQITFRTYVGGELKTNLIGEWHFNTRRYL